MKRKYNESFLELGFASVTSDDTPLPFCVVCKKAFSNSSMTRDKLIKHMDTHKLKENQRTKEYFLGLYKKMNIENDQQQQRQHNLQLQKLTLTSFQLSHLICPYRVLVFELSSSNR